MMTKYCIRWVRWLVECRLNRTCFRGTSWITKSNFWNPDLPYYLQLVWSSQINWPIALNAAEEQILVGFMRAKMEDEDLLFFNASSARGPSGPSFSSCNQPIFVSDRVPFFVCSMEGEGQLTCLQIWERNEKSGWPPDFMYGLLGLCRKFGGPRTCCEEDKKKCKWMCTCFRQSILSSRHSRRFQMARALVTSFSFETRIIRFYRRRFDRLLKGKWIWLEFTDVIYYYV